MTLPHSKPLYKSTPRTSAESSSKPSSKSKHKWEEHQHLHKRPTKNITGLYRNLQAAGYSRAVGNWAVYQGQQSTCITHTSPLHQYIAWSSPSQMYKALRQTYDLHFTHSQHASTSYGNNTSPWGVAENLQNLVRTLWPFLRIAPLLTRYCNLFSHICTPALFSVMYAGRLCQSSGSAGSFTRMIYDFGAMTDETRGRRARPYWAAPRQVAVSASEGRAMTLIREPKIS